ncbi:hypothetical protein ACFWDI_19010 [Streptomyces sp. NPDC060064]|uniref:hypothetical protein n=1 Tax=Streptomyces sp. NPDC060064 TaxID=3347049 RepID=UPI003694B5E0
MSTRTVIEHALTVYYDGNAELVQTILANFITEEATSPAAAPVPDETAGDVAGEVKRRVTRAIHALKSPAPDGSEHYRSGWDDGLEAAIDAARDCLEGGAS